MNDGDLSGRLDALPLGGFHRRLLVASGLGWMFDALDVGLVSFVLAALVGEWKLAPLQVGFISSAGFVGMFAGALIAGLLADRYGRKPLFQATMLVYSLATGLCSLAGGLASLLGLRFLVGLGQGGELPIASTLVAEFSPAKRRGLMIVLLESFWAYGWVLAALIGYLVIPRFGWRVAFLIGALPAVYVLFLRWSVPESPRFLAAKGRVEEADAVVRQAEGGATILLWGSIISSFNLGAWGVVYTYTPELYPTRIRSRGAGSAAFGRIGGIVGPYIVGLLLPAWGAGIETIFIMFAAAFLVVAVVVLALGEETRGASLERLAKQRRVGRGSSWIGRSLFPGAGA